MTTDPFAWPALQLGQRSLPTQLSYERGVWGKAHAERTDFRWLARSGGFDRRQGRALETELNLGTEDLAERAGLWRGLGDSCFAVSCYRSRAVDAAGRQDFLEKQVLEWLRPDELPAALGALLLLPRAAELGDGIWWERRAVLADPAAVLPIEAPDCAPVPCDEGALESAIERGRAALRTTVDEQALEQLYLDLLASRRPAGLAGVHEPLPPEAVGALLLPLPRRLADRVSVAGWIPSSRASLESLGERWDVVVLPPWARPAASGPVDESLQLDARRMAQMILDAGSRLPPPAAAASPATVRAVPQPQAQEAAPPSPALVSPAARDPRRPGLAAELPSPPPGSSEMLWDLHDFASRADRRWLYPDEMRQRWGGDARPIARQAERDLLVSWALAVEKLKPAYADAEQWQAKVDLLRSAALIFAPATRTFQRVGLPAGKRIPSLLFALALHRNRRDELGQLGEAPLREMIEQSLQCRPGPWTAKVRRWLSDWATETRMHQPNVKALIQTSVRVHPA